MRGARHRKRLNHQRTYTYTSSLPPDDLTDADIISDHSRLLQYHLDRFRRETRTRTETRRRTPTVVGRRPGGIGIDITTHSFMDTAPPRLNPALVRIQSKSVRYEETLGDCQGSSYQGITRVEDDLGGWNMDGMRWHQVLRERYAEGGETLRDHRSRMVASEKRGYRTLSWVAMHHMTNVLGLTHSLGEPLFGSYPGLQPVLRPESAAGMRMLQHQSNWVYLQAIPPDDMERWLSICVENGGGLVVTTTLLNLRREVTDLLRTRATAYGEAVVQRGLLRQRNWWTSGDTKTGKGKQKLYLWLIQPEAKIPAFKACVRWLNTAFEATLYPLETGGKGRSYWGGSEAGRLGLYDGAVTLLASDGSAGDTELGAGYTLRRGGMITDWNGMVEGSDEQVTSFRPEAAGVSEGVRAIPIDEDLSSIVDNESVLTVTEAWVGHSHQPSPMAVADADLVMPMVEHVGRRTGTSNFYKVKSHRGEPYNTRADMLADRGAKNKVVTVNRTAARRIIFTVPGYSGTWNNKVHTHACTTAAHSFLPHFVKGVLDAFLARKRMGRAYVGAWWRKQGQRSDAQVRFTMQLFSDTYPTPAKLKLWGLRPSPKCLECQFEWGTLGHIQGHCAATKEMRILCHNRCRKLLTACLKKRARGWELFPEYTCEETISMIREISGIRVPPLPTVSFEDPKTGETRDLKWEEVRVMRVDELAINLREKRVGYNEMTRGWDREEDFYQKKDAFKTAWYRPWVQHLTASMIPHGWVVHQFNFTVGARGTIPEDQWDRYLDHYHVPAAHRHRLYQDLVDSLLDGAYEVIGAYTSHARARVAEGGGRR